MLKTLLAFIWPRATWSTSGEIDWSVSNIDVSLLPADVLDCLRDDRP